MHANRSFGNICGLGASLLLFVGAWGCSCGRAVERDECASNSKLPEDFRPLKGHTDLGNDADSYDGWPRFIYSQRDRMVMVYVPSQTIMMGGGTKPNEVPARTVKVNHFYIDLHEVTNQQYDCFRSSASTQHKCPFAAHHHDCCDCNPTDLAWLETDSDISEKCYNPWRAFGQKPEDIYQYRAYWTSGVNDNHPVRNVSWRESWYYTRWVHKSLPSEAQWEAAARGDDRRIYPWGNQEESEVSKYLCNCKTGRDNFDGYEYTAPVLAYAPGISPFGAYNMAGNVAEWCGDWYDLGRYGYPSDEDPPTGLQRGPKPFGDRYYPNPWDQEIPEDRVGPMSGSERVFRGGSFADVIQRCRVDVRGHAGPDVHQNNIGFRTVLNLPPT